MQDAVDEGIRGVVIVLVNHQPRLFIDQQDVLVLVDDVQLVWNLQKDKVLSALAEKFVVEVKLNQVTLLQAVLRLAAFFVELDALEAERFIEQIIRESGDGFFDKFADPLSGVVSIDDKGFHKKAPFCA